MATRSLQTDYLVVGAGAMGMAFTDALIDHADVHVTLVDRRYTASGHWQDAYPFVQLHQASLFYGVASTVLGRGAVQPSGPEVGLQERARQSEIQAYYDDILHRRFIGSGRVAFLGGCEYHTDGSSHLVTSRVSGETVEVDVRRRVVDATYLSPTIPATTPPPFGVADDARVVPINDLARLTAAPDSYVIVGSGKTATDGIVWLLASGVSPDRIVWVRPRDPWMLNRAVAQLRSGAGHRRLGQRLRPESRAHRTVPAQRSRGARRGRTPERPRRARARSDGRARPRAGRGRLARCSSAQTFVIGSERDDHGLVQALVEAEGQGRRLVSQRSGDDRDRRHRTAAVLFDHRRRPRAYRRAGSREPSATRGTRRTDRRRHSGVPRGVPRGRTQRVSTRARCPRATADPLDESVDQARSKRSRFMTLFHAATKSRTNFSWESSLA